MPKQPSDRNFDYAAIERYAYESKTLGEFAEKADIKYGSLHFCLGRDTKLKEALDAGTLRRKNELPVNIQKGYYKKFTLVQFHGYGLEKLTPKEIATRIELPVICVSQTFRYRPELKEAFEKGQKGLSIDADLGFAAEMMSTFDTDEAQRKFDEALRGAVVQAIGKDNRVLHQISDYTGAGKLRVYIALAELVAAGKIEKIYGGDFPRYGLIKNQGGKR